METCFDTSLLCQISLVMILYVNLRIQICWLMHLWVYGYTKETFIQTVFEHIEEYPYINNHYRVSMGDPIDDFYELYFRFWDLDITYLSSDATLLLPCLWWTPSKNSASLNPSVWLWTLCNKHLMFKRVSIISTSTHIRKLFVSQLRYGPARCCGHEAGS